MDNREANIAGHPPACTCKLCSASRLERLYPGRYTHVPFGGGGKAEMRGLSTSDAEHKGLLRWDGSGFVPPEPSIPRVESQRTSYIRRPRVTKKKHSLTEIWLSVGVVLFVVLLIALVWSALGG